MDSREVKAIIGWLLVSGVPARVTATWDDPALRIHTATSYHYRQGTDGLGLAVDFGSIPPQDTAALRRIYNAFTPVRDKLAELLGPGDPGHSDHVHVAVNKGTFLLPFLQEVPVVPDDPTIPNITGPIEFHPVVSAEGVCTGYYIVSLKTGEIHAWGQGAVFHGRSEVI